MVLVECGGCKRTVMAKTDGTCPSCGAATAGAVAVPVAPMETAEALAWSRHEEDRRERRAAAKRLRERGGNLTMGGVGLAVLGLVVSVGSYVVAEAGGMYVVWSGAIVAGVAMALRGRGLVARARALEAD
jgi:hypothetical protein